MRKERSTSSTGDVESTRGTIVESGDCALAAGDASAHSARARDTPSQALIRYRSYRASTAPHVRARALRPPEHLAGRTAIDPATIAHIQSPSPPIAYFVQPQSRRPPS